MKRFLTFALSFALGVLLCLIVTPYARAHRADPSLIGGEALLPVIPLLVCAAVISAKKDRSEHSGAAEDDDE